MIDPAPAPALPRRKRPPTVRERRARDCARKRTAYRAKMDLARRYLGGRCADCGATEALEFDHDDPRKKTAELTVLWSHGDAFWRELELCVLRCRGCHASKTNLERLCRARRLRIDHDDDECPF